MEKRDRDNIVDEFRTGKTKILIATDLLARGFDVRSVSAMPTLSRDLLSEWSWEVHLNQPDSHTALCVRVLSEASHSALLGKQASRNHGHTSCR